MQNTPAYTVKQSLLQSRVLVIARGVPHECLAPLAEALIKGGITALEVTFDHADPDGYANLTHSLRILRSVAGDALMVGAGTVLSPKEVDLAWEAGAQLIVSPHTNLAVIRRTKTRGLLSIPGAMTPTEIVTAHQAGADLVKVFPAAHLGTGFFQDITAPLPHIPLIAVGGITEENAAAFRSAGAQAVGVGSALLDKKLLRKGDYSPLTRRAKALRNASV